MGSQIGSKTNVKIYVLNLMMAVGYPLDFNTLNEALRQTDFIDYFRALLTGNVNYLFDH